MRANVKKANLILLLYITGSLFLLPKVIRAEESELNFSPFWDFYSNNRLSTNAGGKGYTGIAGLNDISGTILNPASLEIGRHGFQVYFEYVYKNNIQWLKEFTTDVYLKQLHPSFLTGFGVHLTKHLQTGILYYTGNNYNLDLGIIKISDDNGNIIGETPFYEKFKINSFSIPVMVNYKNIRIGGNVKLLHYTIESGSTVKYFEEEFKGEVDFYKLLPEFGVIVSPLKNLSLGATFLPETKETIREKWAPNLNGFTLSSSIKAEWFSPQDSIFNNVFPLKIGIGLQYKFDKLPLAFYLDYNYYDDSKDELLIDRNDIHLGFEYEANSYFILRTGLFKQQDCRDKNLTWNNTVGDYDQIFITLGTSIKLKDFALNLSIMDSHITFWGQIKQTYINAGTSYSF
ncbi:MAG: hypothetical protein PHE49_10325 [bacterium]|nr:hypothetical protein [bacterium]